MSKLVEFFKTYGILFLFVGVTAIGFYYIESEHNKNIVSNFYTTLDTASSVALALLAFYAYFEYAKDKSNTKKFLKQLEKIDDLKNKDAFLGIQFGGGNEKAYLEMESFSKEKGINKNLTLIKQFGDEKNNVSPSDILKLEEYLKKEAMPMLSGADKIHFTVAGAGVAYYTCADIFANWKPIIVYHRNKDGKYEVWASDNKHREKLESTMKDI